MRNVASFQHAFDDMPLMPPKKRTAEPLIGRHPGPQARRRRASGFIVLLVLALAGLWLSSQGFQILSIFHRLGHGQTSSLNCETDTPSPNANGNHDGNSFPPVLVLRNVTDEDDGGKFSGSLHLIEKRWPSAGLRTTDEETGTTLERPDILLTASVSPDGHPSDARAASQAARIAS